MATNRVPALVLGLAAAFSAAPAVAQDRGFGAETPLATEALAEHRGRFAPTTLDGTAVNLSADVGDNVYFGPNVDVMATNNIDTSAFTDAAGVFTVIQNTGNNVVIQTGVAVNIMMVQ